MRTVAEPRFILGTTYTLSLAYFEAMVLRHLRREHLKACVLLCDALGYSRAMDEGASLLKAGLDYTVTPVPCRGSFHAKVW